MTTFNTGNPVPSTAIKDLYDNAENLDDAINGTADSWTDRLGVVRKSWAGFQADFDQFLLDGTIVSKLTWPELSAIVPDSGNGYAQVLKDTGSHTDPVTGEVVPNVGQYVWIPASNAWQWFRADLLSGIKNGYITLNGKDSASITEGLVIYADGSTATSADWNAYYLKVKAGDAITYTGTVGSGTVGQVMMYIGQLDANKAFIASLANWTSTGSQTDSTTLTGTATQDGYVYVRVRVTANFYLSQNAKTLLLESDVDTQGGVASYDSVADILSNRPLLDVTSVASTEYVSGRVIYADGTITDSAGSDWKAAYIPVKSGDTIIYTGKVGSGTAGEVMMYIGQLDADKVFVASLANYTSTGNNLVDGVITGTATQDGYAYVRVRVTTPAATIEATTSRFAAWEEFYAVERDVSDLAGNSETVDALTAGSTEFVDGLVIYYDGTSTAAASAWRAAYIPVKEGDIVTYSGIVGSSKTGEVMMYIGQLDSSKSFVASLANYISTGSSSATATLVGTATQDGYVYVRIRISAEDTMTVTHKGQRFATVEDIFQLQESIATTVAKVFNGPYHNDLSSLPELNPSFDGFENPLSYVYAKQWARRDFYNAADSYMLSFMTLDNNPWNSQSNIYDIVSGNIFGYSWNSGVVTFSSPTANGRTLMFADRYVPHATSEIAIESITGAATIGLLFGDAIQANSVSVRVSNSLVTCETYVAGSLANTTTFTGSDMSGSVLQVQNTGMSLIIKKVSADGSWEWIGRYSYYSYLDARQVSFLDTWKTYVFAQTDAFTSDDRASFTGFSSRLASGANSVSIRFLTYEDGTFIQRGNWLYYLVEGTGTTISDLYTQIVRINFNSGEVQMIGAIFQVRNDGTDEGLLLGDDSIKAVYDRNSSSWKGISCGMEYNDYLSDTNQRPKLYFETKQDLLQGGIVVVRNSKQMKASDGSNFGVGSAYVEDIDFFYDSINTEWVLTGNSITSGCKTFRSPTLYDGISQEFTTSSVPSGVRDTGNQFVKFGSATYLTSGGSVNKLHLRSYESGLTYLGEFNQDVYLSDSTVGPWCTLVPYTNGDETKLFMLSFDRSDLYEGKGNGAATYDHGGLYCWIAVT